MPDGYGYAPRLYSPGSATRSAIQGLGETLTGMSRNRIAAEAVKQKGLTQRAEIGMRGAQVDLQQSLQKLKTGADISQMKHQRFLDTPASIGNIFIESKRREGLDEEQLGQAVEAAQGSFLGQYWDRMTTPRRFATTMDEIHKQPKPEKVPTRRERLKEGTEEYKLGLLNRINVDGFESLNPKEQKDSIRLGLVDETKTVTPEALRKDYENDLDKLRSIERDLANIAKIKLDPNNAINEKIMEAMGIEFGDQTAIDDYEKELLKQKTYRTNKTLDYETSNVPEGTARVNDKTGVKEILRNKQWQPEQ